MVSNSGRSPPPIIYFWDVWFHSCDYSAGIYASVRLSPGTSCFNSLTLLAFLCWLATTRKFICWLIKLFYDELVLIHGIHNRSTFPFNRKVYVAYDITKATLYWSYLGHVPFRFLRVYLSVEVEHNRNVAFSFIVISHRIAVFSSFIEIPLQ